MYELRSNAKRALLDCFGYVQTVSTCTICTTVPALLYRTPAGTAKGAFQNRRTNVNNAEGTLSNNTKRADGGTKVGTDLSCSPLFPFACVSLY
jgi:hypothetical protein